MRKHVRLDVDLATPGLGDLRAARAHELALLAGRGEHVHGVPLRAFLLEVRFEIPHVRVALSPE
jgi:hypothetical protein